jgi:hypothetical protein
MPKAARERVASPPAGTALVRAAACRPWRVRVIGEVGLYVTKPATNVNRTVTAILPRSPDAVQREQKRVHARLSRAVAPQIRGLRDFGVGPSL